MNSNYVTKLMARQYRKIKKNISIVCISGTACILGGLYFLFFTEAAGAAGIPLCVMGGIFLALDLIIYLFSYQPSMKKLDSFHLVRAFPENKDMFSLSERVTKEAEQNTKLTYTIGKTMGQFLELYPSYILNLGPNKIDIIDITAIKKIYGETEPLSCQSDSKTQSAAVYHICFACDSAPEPYIISFDSAEAAKACLDFLSENYPALTDAQ